MFSSISVATRISHLLDAGMLSAVEDYGILVRQSIIIARVDTHVNPIPLGILVTRVKYKSRSKIFLVIVQHTSNLKITLKKTSNLKL